MKKSRLLVVTATLVASLALAACSSGKWGFPYKAPVQQGNWITQQQVDQLKTGMTREQVKFIMGSPTLTSVLNADRWDYPYYYKPGYGKATERKFTVYFDGTDHLARWEGDAQPDLQPYQIADQNAKKDASNAKRDETRAQEGTAQTPTGAQGPITPRVNGVFQGNVVADPNLPATTTQSGTQPLK